VHEYGRPLLTPAEVNQLPQDDGILLVGGLLPYRARKVRYFLDPRFKGRGGLPPPDRPEEQSRELPPRAPSDWDGLVVAPDSEASPAGASDGAQEPPRPPAAPSSDPSAIDADQDVWDRLVAAASEPPHKDPSDDDSQSTEPKDLPL
jgi:type IV secretory pathway TraG/TraD family ATPase VirD4